MGNSEGSVAGGGGDGGTDRIEDGGMIGGVSECKIGGRGGNGGGGRVGCGGGGGISSFSKGEDGGDVGQSDYSSCFPKGSDYSPSRPVGPDRVQSAFQPAVVLPSTTCKTVIQLKGPSPKKRKD